VNIIGSIEFAVQELGTTLVMVVGHEGCGAVEAACNPAREVGHIERLTAAIQPAVELARQQPGDLIDNAVRANVKLMVEQLRGMPPVLAPLCGQDRIKVLGAYYHMNSGEVELLHV
jgi:carbonic anhydrase